MQIDRSGTEIDFFKGIKLNDPERSIDVNGGESGKLKVSGRSRLEWGNEKVEISVPLLLQSDPTEDLHAANKGYVDRVISAGKTWPGRRFEFVPGQTTNIDAGKFSYSVSADKKFLWISSEDLNGMFLNMKGPDHTFGKDFPISIYRFENNHWRHALMVYWGQYKTDYQTKYLKVQYDLVKGNFASELQQGVTYAIVMDGMWG